MTAIQGTMTGERADLLETLRKARYFLRYTARDLTDEQAMQRSTVSELCIGGLIKHVGQTEQSWVTFIHEGPTTSFGDDPAAYEAHAASFQMLPGETLAGIIEQYDRIAEATDELMHTLPDLDADHPLPEAPWNEPGARWTARRVFQHIVAETAQHAGHADILREAIDGAKSMG
jgi:hypothetical protein